MLCNNYNELSHVDKIIYIGELLHAVQSDDHLFDLGTLIIGSARDKGLFEGVVILPDHIKGEDNNENLN